MSPDPLAGRIIDPQTLNKYAYVSNNPLARLDTTGRAWDPWQHVDITNRSYAEAHIPVDKSVVTGVRDRDGGGLDGHNPYVAPVGHLPTWWREQYSPGTQANHFLRDRDESQQQAYRNGVGQLMTDAGSARLALKGGDSGGAKQNIEDALHLVQDSFAHTTRVGGNGAITHIQCFNCVGGGKDHHHPDLYVNGQLTNQGQGSVAAGAAFLIIMQNAAAMSDAQFDQAIQNFLSQFFPQVLNNGLTSEIGGAWEGGWVGGSTPPRKQ